MVGRRIGSYFPLMLGYSVSYKPSNQLIKYEIFGKSVPCGSVGGITKALWGESRSFHFPVTSELPGSEQCTRLPVPIVIL